MSKNNFSISNKLLVSLTTCALLGAAMQAHAAPPPISMPPSAYDAQALPSDGVFGFLNTLNRSSGLLGDLWGLRTALSAHGIALALSETSEVLGNISGGTRKGFDYDGLSQAVLQLDTQRAFGLYGGLFNVSALQIHGKNLSTDHLQTLQTASGIEADPGTRLWELWYAQKFLDENRLSVKIGQQSLDQEFMVSSNALYFVNTMFGWPMLPSADLPAGGPAYPLSALGVRLSLRPVDGVTVLAGVFNGTPVTNMDPNLQNKHGTGFPLGNGTMSIIELQINTPALGSMVEPGQAAALGATYRLGAWYDSQQFADQRFGDDGLTLSDPHSDGQVRMHHGNYAVYAVADQLVWRDARDPNRSVAVFARIMGTPLKERNLIDFSLNAGLVFHSPFVYRTTDTLGVGVGYTHVSSQVSGADRDAVQNSGNPRFVRHSESFIETTYQYQLKPWLQIQPDLQYVFMPGAGVANENDPSQRIRNELVLGVRTNISF